MCKLDCTLPEVYPNCKHSSGPNGRALSVLSLTLTVALTLTLVLTLTLTLILTLALTLTLSLA